MPRTHEPSAAEGTVNIQVEELQRIRRQLEAALADVDAKLKGLPIDDRSHEPTLEAPRLLSGTNGRRGRPVRAVVLDALEDLDWPAYTREIAQYAEARYGRTIASTRFGTLAADEISAFRNKGGESRPVWLCFALTSQRHEPIKRLLARSDWPLERRIHGPTTGRVQHLWITRRLCELALRADESAVDPEMLRIIAADHARDLPGVVVRRGEFDLELWRNVAREQLADLGPRDEIVRKESAARLAKRPEVYQLFGLPDVIEGHRQDVRVESGRA